MTFKDDLGDRMKSYEALTTSAVLNNHLPIVARIDGRSFSAWTRKNGFDKPYADHLAGYMQRTAVGLVQGTRALVGYTQSDEITLMWYHPEPETQAFFGGKVHKLTSVLASMATGLFIREWVKTEGRTMLDSPENLPSFDCRVFGLPSIEEAANCFVWRAKDCFRNAIQAFAQSKYSHKDLQGLTTAQVLDMIRPHGFEQSPAWYRHGMFVVWEIVEEVDVPTDIVFKIRKRAVTQTYNNNFVQCTNRIAYLLGNEPMQVFASRSEAND